MRYLQDCAIALAAGMILAYIFAGCNTPPVNVSANVPVASPQYAPVTSQPVNQDSKAGDTNLTGNENKLYGVGNAFNVNGGTITAVVAVLVAGGCVIYLKRRQTRKRKERESKA